MGFVIDKEGNYLQVFGESASGGGSYVLPTASASTLGGVKIDDNTIKINNNGVISQASNQYVSSYSLFINKVIIEESTETIDLSNYLPNDSNTYEVMFRFYMNATSDSFVSGRIYDGTFITSTNKLYIGSVAAQVYKYSTVIMTTPIGTGRELKIDYTGALQKGQVEAFGYKKVI
jgi:hypothetical protein